MRGKIGLLILIVLTVGAIGFYYQSYSLGVQGTNSGAVEATPTPEHLGQFLPEEFEPQVLDENLNDVLIVDVRTKDEYDQGHVVGAIHMEYDDIDGLSRLETDKQVVVYCTLSSWRAPYAAYTLYQHGHEDVALLQGGAFAWEEEGGQVVATNQENGEIVPKPTGLIPNSPVEDTTLDPLDRPFTAEILSYYNGQEGKPAYVAFEGVVYDVTESPLWQNGVHRPAIIGGFLEVRSGTDLTSWMKFSPHGKSNLERFPVVGRFVQ